MRVLQSVRRRWFTVSMFASFSIVAAIPGIVFSAINGLWFVMGVSIALAAFGFYGTPLFWIGYGRRAALCRLVASVNAGILSVGDLSSQLGWNARTVRASLRECIAKGYIEGYFFDGNRLSVIRVEAPPPDPDTVPVSVVCPFCGASGEITRLARKCEFCGGQIPYPED